MTLQEAVEQAIREGDKLAAMTVAGALAELGMTFDQTFEVIVGICPEATREAWASLVDLEPDAQVQA